MSIKPSSVLAVLLLGVATVAARADEPPAPTLTFPDGSVVTLPRGSKVFGPTPQIPRAEATPKAPPPDPAPRADEPAKPEPTPSAAEVRRTRIDELFTRLAAAKDTTEAAALVTMIDRLWLQSGSPTADLLMQRAVQVMSDKNTAAAERLLDKLVELRPGWAEAWNKRATVRYLENDDAGSMADISHVLALEPRHFGALNGMGFILHRNGDNKAALGVLRKAAAINPQQPDIKALIEQLTPDVEGRDL